MSGAVKNRTYRPWGKYSITELFSETSSNRTYWAGEAAPEIPITHQIISGELSQERTDNEPGIFRYAFGNIVAPFHAVN